jgi:hypothetical protein
VTRPAHPPTCSNTTSRKFGILIEASNRGFAVLTVERGMEIFFLPELSKANQRGNFKTFVYNKVYWIWYLGIYWYSGDGTAKLLKALLLHNTVHKLVFY